MQNQSTNVLKISAVALIITAVTSCGLDSDSHYNPDNKTFSRAKPISSPLTTPTTPQQPPLIPPPAVPPSPDNEQPDSDEPISSGRDILASQAMSGYFNRDAITWIVNKNKPEGSLEKSSFWDGVLSWGVGDIGASTANEKLNIETREDGKERQIVTEVLSSSMADKLAAYNKSKDSQSGTQKLYWLLTNAANPSDCPKTFICVDKIEWIPFKGQSYTYCMKNADSDQPTTVPYAPNPNFGPDAFKASLPNNFMESKPFRMTRHVGIVACDAPDLVATDMQILQWKVSLGDLKDAAKPDFYRTAKFKPVKPDTEVIVEFGRYSQALGRRYQPSKAPFLEETSRFNTKTRYFLDSSEHILAKLILTIQGAASIPLTSVSGVQLEYHQEFCINTQDSRQPFNHCTGQ